ncbi:MAG: SatD family protein [Gemmatimonadota bacterium]
MKKDDRGAYCAVLADVVRSRSVTEAQALQSALESAASRLGRVFGDELAAEATITSGDEVQILLHSPESAFDVMLELVNAMHPMELRFGVGRGELQTPLRPTTGSLSGPVFYAAREALDRARRQGWAGVFDGFGERSETLTVLADCALSIVGGWTPAQRESARAYLERGTQEAAAKALGLHRTTVTRNLERGLVRQVIRCRDHLHRLLSETAGAEGSGVE